MEQLRAKIIVRQDDVPDAEFFTREEMKSVLTIPESDNGMLNLKEGQLVLFKGIRMKIFKVTNRLSPYLFTDQEFPFNIEIYVNLIPV